MRTCRYILLTTILLTLSASAQQSVQTKPAEHLARIRLGLACAE